MEGGEVDKRSQVSTEEWDMYVHRDAHCWFGGRAAKENLLTRQELGEAQLALTNRTAFESMMMGHKSESATTVTPLASLPTWLCHSTEHARAVRFYFQPT